MYFRKKFLEEGISDWDYFLLEREVLQPAIRNEFGANWRGFNVTVPHKRNIIPFLDQLDPIASKIAAVNVVRISWGGLWQGFNSDYHGFLSSLLEWKPTGAWKGKSALIIGNGGSSAAVKAVLESLGMEIQVAARNPGPLERHLDSLRDSDCQAMDLLVQCTPEGMFPKMDSMPLLPPKPFRAGQYVVDLIYNPAQTRFLDLASSQGAITQNGLSMLHAQAEKAWEIWTMPDQRL
jgi:shikimate dehydrogenase